MRTSQVNIITIFLLLVFDIFFTRNLQSIYILADYLASNFLYAPPITNVFKERKTLQDYNAQDAQQCFGKRQNRQRCSENV